MRVANRAVTDGNRLDATGHESAEHSPEGGVLNMKHTRTDSERARDREAFTASVQQIRRQLHKMESWTIQPNGKFMHRWDMTTMAALGFVALVTPFEVALLPASLEGGMLVLFIFNKIVDVLFLVDIAVQFFVPFRSREGMWIMDKRQMAMRYAMSIRPGRSFAVDVIASMPYDTVIMAFAGSVDGGGGGGPVRLLKMLRIIK